MRKKLTRTTIFLILILCSMLVVSCRTTPPKSTNPLPTGSLLPSPTASLLPSPTTTASAPASTADVKTTASIVSTGEAFEKAISNKGTWIIAIINDLTINKDLVLDGEYKNGKKDTAGKDIIQRKVALYAQDANRNITARYTLTAPKLTINSPNASLQHGTFKGDVYVKIDNFQLIDATVDGNVYFASDSAKSTFKMDTSSKVTGKQEIKKP